MADIVSRKNFYEAVACGVPVVAAKVGTMKELLKKTPEMLLYRPEDANSLLIALRPSTGNPATAVNKSAGMG
ncbi:MAG: hypothetical protein U5K27_13710 [Desulfotignum sp.]|nr:hypothetical protein [Desulfotignum sp.]